MDLGRYFYQFLNNWNLVPIHVGSVDVAVAIIGAATLTLFFIAERECRNGTSPPVSAYAFNVLTLLLTVSISYWAGIAANQASSAFNGLLGWQPMPFAMTRLESGVPFMDGISHALILIFVPLLVHDFTFYWLHRLEHRLPLLWLFHRVHHSDPHLNASTFFREHVFQTAWRSFFSIFVLGLVFELNMVEAGQAATYSAAFLMIWSMFCHSAIDVELRWLDRILVTPQVHRIHHAADPALRNRNFADVFPVVDMLFGTYRRPAHREFPQCGLGEDPPHSVWQAQARPFIEAWSLIGVERLRLEYVSIGQPVMLLPRIFSTAWNKSTALPLSSRDAIGARIGDGKPSCSFGAAGPFV